MSRIGKQPVVVPSGVTVTVSKDNQLTVKGPKGELKQTVDRDITIEVKDGQVIFNRPTDQIRHRAMHGLYRALVENMVKGVTQGFKKISSWLVLVSKHQTREIFLTCHSVFHTTSFLKFPKNFR